MKIIADLQLHSKYSRAVSQRMNVEEIYSWAVKKGMGLMATGDWTHPLWLRELKAKLVEDESGFLRLRESSETKISSLMNSSTLKDSGSRQTTTRSQILSSSDSQDSPSRKDFHGASNQPHFLLATEISSIYTQGGKVRRIHNLIWAPSFATVDKIIAELNKRGCNLGSDGRPIVGLTSREIAELVLSVDESCLIIPAHIWTPWFSLYGSKSGFDSIEECFGDYAKYIYAIETGLSSDPVMNWRIRDLATRAILSFSDAHSGPKLGREATVFELTEMTYGALREAITSSQSSAVSRQQSAVSTQPSVISNRLKPKTDNRQLKTENRISCTFEFYPEEGKYHYTGHRLCHVKQTPVETKKMGTICHVCWKPLTVGVIHRVEELATSNVASAESDSASPQSTIVPLQKIDGKGVRWMYHPTDTNRPPYVNLVPLLEIIAEVYETAATSVKVSALYEKLIGEMGSEFTILLKADLQKITAVAGDRMADAIKKVRAGDIFIDPGYDGEFGKVKIWPDAHPPSVSVQTGESEKKAREQMSLF